jgi:TonB family protein
VRGESDTRAPHYTRRYLLGHWIALHHAISCLAGHDQQQSFSFGDYCSSGADHEFKPGIIAGQLLSTEGTPLNGVRVIALETSYPRLNIVGQAETDKDGRYRLEGMPVGAYFIVADPFKIPSYYPGTGSRDDSTPVSVTAGAANGIDFKFVRSSGILRAVRTHSSGETRFSGFLQDTWGKGLPNFTVMLSSYNTQATLWTVTDTTGSFEFASLAAGEYSMEAFGPVQELYEDLRIPITLQADESLQQHVGVRQLGNFQQRPDLYGPGDPRERLKALRQNGPGAPTFWRCQDVGSQVQPEYPAALRAADVKGSVVIQANVDPNGKLVRLRIMSSNINPELARAAVRAVAQWKFTPLKWKYVSASQTFVSCDGEGDVREFQGTVEFE